MTPPDHVGDDPVPHAGGGSQGLSTARLTGLLNGTYATIPMALRPRGYRLTARPQETVKATFASGHGWTATGTWASSNLNDTSDQGWAAQVVSGVTPGTAAGVNFVKTTGVTSFDPTGKYFCVLAKVDDPTKIGSIQLSLGADSSFTNSASLTAMGGSASGLLPGQWGLLIFSFDGAVTAGTGVGTACVALKIRVADKGSSQAATVAFGGVSMLAPASTYTNGVVSFTFDDAFASLYSVALPMLSAYRYRATAYPILDLLDTGGRLTTAQVKALETIHGWEVGGHASTLAQHALGLPSVASKDAELQAVKQWLITNGLRGDTYAYPSGLYDQASVDAVRRYFTGGRSTDGAQKETLPAADPAKVRAFQITAATSTGTLTGLVDNAYTYAHHLVFNIHDVVASGATGIAILTATLQTLVDYCNTKGVPVRPLGEVLTA